MRSRTGLATSLITIAGVLGVAAGCAEAGVAWAGTFTDSAGIRIASNPATSEWPDGAAPVLEEQLRIGSAGGDVDYQFGQIVAMDVGVDGSIYVLDQQAGTIRVFDAAGRFVREIGRRGSGPGELSQGVGGLMLGSDETILVPDPLLQRITRFAADGSPAGEWMLSFTEGIPLRFEQLPDRRVVQQSRVMPMPGQTGTVEPTDRLLVHAADGTLGDTLLAFPAGGTFDFASGGPPRIRIFEPEPMWAIGLDGRLYYGVNSAYSIEVRTADGTLERIIRKPFERKPVSQADQQVFRDLMAELFQRQGLPPNMLETMTQMISFADQYPAFANVMGGPGNTLWVQHVRTASEAARGGQIEDPRDTGSPVWDVFDNEGRLLGVVELADKFTPLHITADEMWGVWRDELDVQYIVKYRVSGLSRS